MLSSQSAFMYFVGTASEQDMRHDNANVLNVMLHLVLMTITVCISLLKRGSDSNEEFGYIIADFLSGYIYNLMLCDKLLPILLGNVFKPLSNLLMLWTVS